MISNRKPLGIQLETLKEPAYLKNSVGIYVDVNDKFAALVGTSRDRICGHTDLDLPGKPSVLLGRHQKDVTFFKSQLTEQESDFYINNRTKAEWKVHRKLIYSKSDEPYLIAKLSNEAQSDAIIPLWVEPFRSVYDSHPEPILMIEKAKLVYCNKAFLQLGSFQSLEDVLCKPLDKIFDYSQLSLSNKLSELQRVHRTVRSQGLYKAENYLLSADNTLKPVEISIYKVDVMGRTPFGMTLKDNSQLEDKRYQMERIAKNAPVVIFRFARKNNGEYFFKYLSDRCYEIFGYSPDEILKDSQKAFSPLEEEDRNDFFNRVEESARVLKKFHWEGYTLSSKGERKFVQVSSEPYRTDFEVIWDGVIVDKTESKAVESSLEKSQALMNELFQNLPVGIYSRKVENGYPIEYCNQALESSFGIKLEEVRGQSSCCLLRRSSSNDCEEGNESIYDQVVRTRTTMVLERAEYETLSGSKIQCREIVFPIISDNECIMVAGIIQDLTEEVQLLEVLEQQKNQLKSQSKLSSLGQVSASLVHEINNPISVIMGFASQAKKMLEKGIGSNSIPLEEDSEKIINKIEKIESMAWRIGKIISGLKKLSRDGQNDPIEFFSLSEVIEESLSLTRESFRFHSIRLEVSEVEASLNISGRVVEVSQILVNLLVNASDAIEGLDSPWVRLSFCESLDADYIYIEDSGPGIPENIVDQVMRPFFTTKAVGKGTGLGLSISKKIMESHGGELIYDSQAPNTCFILKFPKLNSGIKSEAA